MAPFSQLVKYSLLLIACGMLVTVLIRLNPTQQASAATVITPSTVSRKAYSSGPLPFGTLSPFGFYMRPKGVEDCDCDQDMPVIPTCSIPHLFGPGEWVHSPQSALSNVYQQKYDCTCPYMKASFYCNKKMVFSKWLPDAAKDDLCRYPRKDGAAAGGYLPPNSNILFAGGENMREMVESMLCMHPQTSIVKRQVLQDGKLLQIKPEAGCRGHDSKTVNSLLDKCPLWNPALQQQETETAMCTDDYTVINFANGSSLTFVKIVENPSSMLDHIARIVGGAKMLLSYSAIVVSPSSDTPNANIHIDDFVSDYTVLIEQAKKRSEVPPKALWVSNFVSEDPIHSFFWDNREPEIITPLELLLETGYLTFMDAKAYMDLVRGPVEDKFCMPAPYIDDIAMMLLLSVADMVRIKEDAVPKEVEES